jgi:quinol monooxygenase YgiN
MAVTALLELRIKPEALSSIEDLLRKVLADTRAFPGCLGVEVLVDHTDPAHITLQESWESVEHDNAYRAWRASPEGVSGLGDVVAAPPVLTVFTTLFAL